MLTLAAFGGKNMRPESCAFLCAAVLLALTCVSAPFASGESHSSVVTDTNPPTGTVLYPLPGTWVGYTSLQVRFTDPDGVMASSLSMTVDGIPLVTSWTGIVLSASAQGLPDGPHTAEARASDQLGTGPTIVSWSFSVDGVPPEVRITNPSGNPVLADGSLNLTWTGTDEGSGIKYYVLRLDNDPSFPVGNVTTFRFSSLSPGIHYFYVVAYDAAGNYNYPAAIAVGTAPLNPQNPATTTVVVSMPGEIPSWAVALIAISSAEFVAILWLAFRHRREPRGGEPPDR